MIKTFDLVLNYYDSPGVLKNWLHRLLYHSDFKKFSNRCQVIFADSGSPRDKIANSTQIIDQFYQKIPFKYAYLRSDTDELRKLVPQGFADRMMGHGLNNAVLDFSSADMIIISNVGVIFSPDYFNGHVAEHIKSDRSLVLPKRFDLFSDTYHESGFDKPWEEVLKGDVRSSGGWPDMSVKRQWLVEVGAWDEWYQFISPNDMDLGSRLSGKLDNGAPSELLYPADHLGPYANLGLNFVQPYRPTFLSLTCNTYKGHIPGTARKASYEFGEKYYKANWSKIKRNEGRIPTKFEVIAQG